MLVFSVHAVGLDQMITATTRLVQLVARILEHAMNTKLTSEVRVHAMTVLSRPMATAILLPVPTTNIFVLATNTGADSVVGQIVTA